MTVSCNQYIYHNAYGPVAKVTALISKELTAAEAKKLIVKEILGNYTSENNIAYTAKLEKEAIRDTQDSKIGDMKLAESYIFNDIDEFHILDFHKLKAWVVN